jgi:hypothetical protein
LCLALEHNLASKLTSIYLVVVSALSAEPGEGGGHREYNPLKHFENGAWYL